MNFFSLKNFSPYKALAYLSIHRLDLQVSKLCGAKCAKKIMLNIVNFWTLFVALQDFGGMCSTFFLLEIFWRHEQHDSQYDRFLNSKSIEKNLQQSVVNGI